jgi:hypothetical protein
MAAGQLVNVIACAATGPADGAVLAGGAIASGVCPDGQVAYVVPAYVPFAESAAYIDGLMSQFDPSVAGGLFGFGFGLVVFFYLLGLKGSVLIKPFWSGWH